MRRRKTRELVIKAIFAYEIEKGDPYFHLDYISEDAEMGGYTEGETEKISFFRRGCLCPSADGRDPEALPGTGPGH